MLWLTRSSTILALLGAALSVAGAQTVGTNQMEGQNGTFTLSVSSQLVVETVVVKDKDGHFVPGLTEKDFKVEEDGVPQTIRIFEHQALAKESTPLPVEPPDQEQITLYRRLARTQIAPEVPGKTQYSGHRLLALYFDMTAMPPDDQMRALHGGGEVCADADDAGGSGGDHALQAADRWMSCRILRRIATGC